MELGCQRIPNTCKGKNSSCLTSNQELQDMKNMIYENQPVEANQK